MTTGRADTLSRQTLFSSKPRDEEMKLAGLAPVESNTSQSLPSPSIDVDYLRRLRRTVLTRRR